jgi:transcriptional regulator GlxA family with amidase domain
MEASSPGQIHTDSPLASLIAQLGRDLQEGAVPVAGVADLARAAGVSVRTVYRASARHLGGPPMTRLRDSRLEHVRRRLLEAAPGETVTSVAMEWGFLHLGRFSSLYRRRFGELPSQTLRRARATRRVGSRPPRGESSRPSEAYAVVS